MDSDSLDIVDMTAGDDQMLPVSKKEISLTMQAKESHFERLMKRARTVRMA